MQEYMVKYHPAWDTELACVCLQAGVRALPCDSLAVHIVVLASMAALSHQGAGRHLVEYHLAD